MIRGIQNTPLEALPKAIRRMNAEERKRPGGWQRVLFAFRDKEITDAIEYALEKFQYPNETEMCWAFTVGDFAASRMWAWVQYLRLFAIETQIRRIEPFRSRRMVVPEKDDLPFPFPGDACHFLIRYMAEKKPPETRQMFQDNLEALRTARLPAEYCVEDCMSLFTTGINDSIAIKLFASEADRTLLTGIREQRLKRRYIEHNTDKPVSEYGKKLIPIYYLCNTCADFFFAGDHERARRIARDFLDLYQIRGKKSSHPCFAERHVHQAITSFLDAQDPGADKEKLYRYCISEIYKKISRQTREGDYEHPAPWRLLEIMIYIEMGWETPFCIEFLKHFPELTLFHPPAQRKAEQMGVPLEPLPIDENRIREAINKDLFRFAEQYRKDREEYLKSQGQ